MHFDDSRTGPVDLAAVAVIRDAVCPPKPAPFRGPVRHAGAGNDAGNRREAA